MSKAQSLILQFIMFFMAGFIVFITVGSFFKYQSDLFRDDVANRSIDLVANYLSSAVISQVDSCKGCDYARYSLKLQNTTAGYFMEFSLGSDGLTISTSPVNKEIVSDLYNLKDSIEMSGSGTSVEPINLTLRRTKNELRVE